MKTILTRALCLVVAAAGLGVAGAPAARAQLANPTTLALLQQERFVQFLAVRQEQFARMQAQRLAVQAAFVARLNQYTQRMPANLQQAMLIHNTFTFYSRVVAQYQMATMFNNLLLARLAARTTAVVSQLQVLAPGDPVTIRLAMAYRRTQALTTYVMTATPAQPLQPLPFPGV